MPDWFAQNAPTSSAGGNWFAANAPSAPRRPVSAEDFLDQSQQPQGSALGRFASNAWEMLNPVSMVKGVVHAVAHPVDTAEALVGAQVGEGRKALDLARQGRYTEAAGHSAAFALPVLGPAAAAAGEQIAAGDVAGGLGKAGGLIAPLAAGAVLPESISAPGIARNANPIATEAVELAQRSGVPVDAATATGNRFVGAVQHLSDRSLGGSFVAQKAAQRQSTGLATLGEQLAAKGYANPVTLEQAGEAVKDAVLEKIRGHNRQADASYNVLRRIEANPANARPVKMADGHVEMMPLPVDLSAAQKAFRPVYEELSAQARLTPAAMMGDKARALNALEKIMTAPASHAPLSTVDGLLSDLKSFARTDVPELRSAGQGAAAEAIKHIDAQVKAAAQKAGPLAEAALRTGRDATIAKYGAGDVLQGLADEPVRTVNRLMAPKDTAIDQLRTVAKQAPDALPQIGRAYLADMLERATSEGGFGHAKGLAAQWEKLGTQTKLMVFKDAGYVRDLDRFWQLTKMASESSNPSGTAHTLLTAGQGGLILTNPIAGVSLQLGTAALSSLLHSPAGVKLLTRGMTLPVKNRVAAAAWLADLTNAGVNLTSPTGSQTPGLAPARSR